jgi:hypothetical protein
MRRVITYVIILILTCVALYFIWLLIDTLQEERESTSVVPGGVCYISTTGAIKGKKADPNLAKWLLGRGKRKTENGRKQPNASSVTLSRLVWGNPSLARMPGQVKTLLPVAEPNELESKRIKPQARVCSFFRATRPEAP